MFSMCGIAGFLGDFHPRVLDDFQQRLEHRGPDGFGLWKDEKAFVGLAHRRLSIIDLSTAASQPMRAVDGRYTVVFNGEIYNFKSLVPLLKDRGYDFNENSDTAVLAPLYDAFGTDMLGMLEGMFAFAIWDAKERELFVARDHLGIKPLYYAHLPEGLVFASELKALLGVKGLDTTPDAAALAEYLTFLWTPSARTLARGISKLRPGCFLKAAYGKDKALRLHIKEWYAPPLAPMGEGRPLYDRSKTPRGLLEVFDFVVAEQCVADVPLGAFLSGGVDSSAIVASMCMQGHKPKATYCIGFEGAGMASEGFGEDIDYARAVASRYDVMLNEVRVDTAKVMERMPGLAFMLDEPCADPAPLFVEDISLAARADGLKVLMSGTGGDDVMTGYRRHVTARLRQKLGALGPMAAWGMTMGSTFLHGAQKRRAQRLAGLLACSDDDFLRLAFMTNSQPDAWKLLDRDLRAQLASGWRTDLDRSAEQSVGQDLVDRVLYAELHGFLPDHNLNYGDKAGMAAGVEIRVPFTDRRLLDYMADVPPAWKLQGVKGAKAFFKESQKERLPESILTRSKTGFGAPVRGWLLGAGRGLVEETLFGGADMPFFDIKAVGNLWQRVQRGQTDGAYTMLALCMCCWWLQSTKRTAHGTKNAA